MDLLKLPYEHQFTHEWKLKKSELEALKTSKCGNLFSTDYIASKIADTRYYFGIYPNGYNDKNEGDTFIYFFLESDNIKEAEAKYEISIVGAKFCRTFEYIHKSFKPYGLIRCNRDKFFIIANKYFVNDELVIKINGILKFDRPLVSKTVYPVSAKWIIKSSELEPFQHSEINACINSETFIIPSHDNISYFLTRGPIEV